jgi:hypothetical protein
LLSYWFSLYPAFFQDWLLNVIIKLRGGHFFGDPGRGTSQVEKSPHLDYAYRFLTVAYDGACSPSVSVGMAWI